MTPETAIDAKLTDDELESLLAATRSDKGAERRVDPRYPFFTSVTLHPLAASERTISAFSREISRGGLGLLHAGPISLAETYEVEIRIQQIKFRRQARVIWCRSAGDGWFLSGCQFV